ncbi:hypothetical protein HZS_298 [Henneguya salminicola]|nr:hypothetical protein HZS_298 [Henneguya salminicola]
MNFIYNCINLQLCNNKLDIKRIIRIFSIPYMFIYEKFLSKFYYIHIAENDIDTSSKMMRYI